MVEASRRRLDPLQPALGNDLVPRHGNFCVPTEYIRPEDFSSYPLLSSIYDLRIGGCRGNLPHVSGLCRVTKYDSHLDASQKRLAERRQWTIMRKGLRVVPLPASFDLPRGSCELLTPDYLLLRLW